MKKAIKITGIIAASLFLLAVTGAFVLGITPLSLGLHKPVYTQTGKALAGYDAVSYFQGKPVLGSEQFAYKWRESTWLFSSAENLNTFKTDPEKFMPAYGGYCTKAVSTGFAAPGNPEVWLIKDGQLFLFASEAVKEEFIKDPESITAACNKAWQ